MPLYGAADPSEFVQHFDRNFNEIKDEMYAAMPREYNSYMRVVQDNKAFYRSTYIGGLGLPIQNRDNEPIPFKRGIQGPPAQFEPVQYRLGYQIEKQTIEQENWGLLANRPKTMMYGANVLMDQVCANLFNNGFTLQPYDVYMPGYPTPLFSTAIEKEDLSGTYSNLIATNLPITVESLFQVITSLLFNLDDSAGLPIQYNGAYTIYVPTISPVLWQQANEVVNSLMNPNTADNAINAVKNQFKINIQTLRLLTNPNHWFVGWEPSSPNYGLLMYVNLYPEMTSLTQFGNNPDVWFSRLRTRFVAGYENRRGIAGVGA